MQHMKSISSLETFGRSVIFLPPFWDISFPKHSKFFFVFRYFQLCFEIINRNERLAIKGSNLETENYLVGHKSIPCLATKLASKIGLLVTSQAGRKTDWPMTHHSFGDLLQVHFQLLGKSTCSLLIDNKNNRLNSRLLIFDRQTRN